MKSFMKIGPHVFRNPEHRRTDTATLYVYYYCIENRVDSVGLSLLLVCM